MDFIEINNGNSDIDSTADIPDLAHKSHFQYKQAIEYENYIEFEGIRITPKKVVFNGAYSGKKFEQIIIVQNVSKKKIEFRLERPSAFAFKVIGQIGRINLAPGMSIKLKVKYTVYSLVRDAVRQTQMPVYVDSFLYMYKMEINLAKPVIRIEPAILSFGVVNIDQNTVRRDVYVFNDGDQTTPYTTEIKSLDIDVLIEPFEGLLQAKRKQKLHCQLIKATLGYHLCEFWIKCKPVPIKVPVEVYVIQNTLTINHINCTKDVTVVDFPVTVFGGHRRDSILLKNSSVSPTTIIIMFQQEQNFYNLEDKEAINKFCPDLNNFTLSFTSGTLEPFEGRIVTIDFHPKFGKFPKKGWKSTYENQDFIVFLKLVNVQATKDNTRHPLVSTNSKFSFSGTHCSTAFMNEGSKNENSIHFTESTASTLGDNVDLLSKTIVTPLRLCIHGDAKIKIVDIQIQPDSISLDPISKPDPVYRVVCMTNCTEMGIAYLTYIKCPCVFVEPEKFSLRANESIDVSLKLVPKTIGQFNVSVTFEIKFQDNVSSDIVFDSFCNVDLNYEILSVLYQKKIPTSSEQTLVDFKNRSKLKIMYQPYYSKQPRYIPPPNPEFALTTSNEQFKTNIREYYNKFIRRQSGELLKLQPCEEYLSEKWDDSFSNILSTNEIKRIQQFDCCNFQAVPSKTKITSHISSPIHIPLTPWQLYNIEIAPTVVEFKKVSTDLPTERYLTVTNQNNFSIKITLRSQCKEVTFPISSTIFLHANDTQLILIRFMSENLGRFRRPIEYMINDCHPFEFNVIANVVEKRLHVVERSISFEIVNVNSVRQNLFRPVTIINNVHTYTNFFWRIPEDHQYEVFPERGIVPPNRTMLCQIYRKPEFPCKYETDLFFVPEEGHEQTIKVFFNSLTPKVVLMDRDINVGVIPLNLTRIASTFLYNLTNVTVSFVILNPEPISGVLVTPTKGILHPRAVRKIMLTLKIPAVIEFNFNVYIRIQDQYKLHLNVKGVTSFPLIIIKPKVLRLRRLSVDSFDRMAFTIKNDGITDAVIKILLPTKEFYVSKDENILIAPYDDKEELILLPNRIINLYIHFFPENVASYEFYLSIIVNDIVGPSTLEVLDSLNPMFFIEKYQRKYLEKNDFKPPTISSIPRHLRTLKIIVVVWHHILQISKQHAEFYCSNMPNGRNCTQQKITIKNLTESSIKFLIRRDFLYSTPFEVETIGEIVKTTDAVIIENELLPKTNLEINLIFQKTKNGSYSAKLPLFAHNYDMNNIYNFLTLNGTYDKPRFSIDAKVIYFAPIPLNILSVRQILIKFEQYVIKSKLHVNKSNSFLKVKFPDGNTLINNDDSPIYLPVLVCFQSDRPQSFLDNLTFEDENGNSCNVMVYACADNCQLTVYEFLMAYRECYNICESDSKLMDGSDDFSDFCPQLELSQSFLTIHSNVITHIDSLLSDVPCIDFPKYPRNSDCTEIKEYLDEIVYFTEMMIFQQFCQFQYYLSIPDGLIALTAPCNIIAEKGKLHESQSKGTNKFCNIYQFLLTVFGKIVYSYFDLKPIPEDKNERILHIYHIFNQLVTFITVQGGCVNHIDPMYLMNYDAYLILVNEILTFTDSTIQLKESERVLLERNDYERLCKRMWLDMALQIYKIVTLSQIVVSATVSTLSNPNIFQNNATNVELVNVNDTITSNIFSTAERTLIIWLNRHYRKHYRSDMFEKYGNYPTLRTIRNFTTDLNDALPFICVTASYCPYLVKECFYDLYGRANTREMALHNATRLIDAWEFLRMNCFCICPKDILDANPILMLFITFNIYMALPNYVSQSTLFFTTPLLQPFTKEIDIMNKELAYYKAIIRGDRKKNFTIDNNDVITVKPKKRAQIRVTYQSTIYRQVTAVLIIRGEVVPGNFSNPVVYILVGQPKIAPYQTISLQVPLYENKDISFQINVPNTENCDYEIYCTDLIPENLEKFETLRESWQLQVERKMPEEIIVLNETLIFRKNKPTILNCYVSKMSKLSKILYVLFSNKDVSEFIVEIVTVALSVCKQLSYIFPVIECCHTECISKKGYGKKFEKCDCVQYVSIPRRNEFWWSCFRQSFMKKIHPDEQEIWLKRLETKIGHRLLQWLSIDEEDSDNKSALKIFKTKETYKVVVSSNKLRAPSEITIDKINIPGTYDLPVIAHKPGKYTVKLISIDQQEERCFVLQFIEPRSSICS